MKNPISVCLLLFMLVGCNSTSEDADLIVQDVKVDPTLKQDWAGRKASVWTTGVVAQSKPVQVFAVKMVME